MKIQASSIIFLLYVGVVQASEVRAVGMVREVEYGVSVSGNDDSANSCVSLEVVVEVPPCSSCMAPDPLNKQFNKIEFIKRRLLFFQNNIKTFFYKKK